MAAHDDTLRRLEATAAAEGKKLGEWLYEALTEPFQFRGDWSRPGMSTARNKYNRAAKAFASRLIRALGKEDHA